jgi:hypothetical protein
MRTVPKNGTEYDMFLGRIDLADMARSYTFIVLPPLGAGHARDFLRVH